MAHFNKPDAATAFEIEECIVRFQEIAGTPVAGGYLLTIASKAKTALDRAFGPGNVYTTRLIQIVMADLRSAREDVPPTVAQAVLPLLRQVARGCMAEPMDPGDAAVPQGRRRTDGASCLHSGTRMLRNAGRRASDVAGGAKPWPLDARRHGGATPGPAAGAIPQRRASDRAGNQPRPS